MYVPLPEQRDPVDPGPGKHLWITLASFRIPEQAIQDMAAGKTPAPVLLDHENLLLPPSIGCYKCELPFSPRRYNRACTASMEAL